VCARLVIGLLLALSLVSGPQGIAQEAEKPLTPRSSPDALRVPTDAEDAALFHTIVRTITYDLALPVVDVTIERVDDGIFDQILAYQRLRSKERSDLESAVGVALGNRILVRSDELTHMTVAERARLYAHELAHVAQVRLGNGAPRLTWLVEGHADWVAYQVGERLGHRGYAESRDRVKSRVRAAPLSKARFPALSDLETSERWLHATNRLGWAATYGQALLAVDRLVERYSASTLREFVRRSDDSDSRLRAIDERSPFAGAFAHRDWNAVFPVAYHDFVAEFRTDLERLR